MLAVLPATAVATTSSPSTERSMLDDRPHEHGQQEATTSAAARPITSAITQ